MSIYEPLHNYLKANPRYPVEMSEHVLNRVLPQGLPRSAWKWRAWWANDFSSGTHSHAEAWQRAGRRVEWVDLEARRVRFSAASTSHVTAPATEFRSAG